MTTVVDLMKDKMQLGYSTLHSDRIEVYRITYSTQKCYLHWLDVTSSLSPKILSTVSCPKDFPFKILHKYHAYNFLSKPANKKAIN